ncbi:NUDIX domain-containing protein [Xylanimonas protaetiae]|uniref:NUDIX hydrolase n=1 Tax=Xylanimonas protaetiae TaxID=2509457 RepID=A0A4P6FJU7_9MICO|nr:NUDIX hydrolase [Xylanimonas protaetiae]QAY70888.1 NUDIX hydrolase [Xylanimonas protaetiae]
MAWTTRTSRTAYENRWIRVREDEVVMPDGHDGVYGVVELRNEAVFVVALDDEDRVLLVDVDRYTVGRSLEVVAGGSDGDDPLVAAQRELREEAGLEAATWVRIGAMDALNGVCVAPEVVFLARGLRPAVSAEELAATHAEEGIAATRWVPFPEVLGMVARGEIRDGETMAALALAGVRLGRFR